MLLFAYANSIEYKAKRKKTKKENKILEYCTHRYSDGKAALVQFGDECKCNICGKRFSYINLKNK